MEREPEEWKCLREKSSFGASRKPGELEVWDPAMPYFRYYAAVSIEEAEKLAKRWLELGLPMSLNPVGEIRIKSAATGHIIEITRTRVRTTYLPVSQISVTS